MPIRAVDRRGRRARAGVRSLPALLLTACSSSSATVGDRAPAPAAAARPPVEVLLDLSKVESIVSGRASPFTRRVALLGGDLTDPELERLVPAVREGFASPRMRADVATFLAEAAPEGTIETLVARLGEGAGAELTRVTSENEPALSLEEYARSLAANPPPRERVAVVVAWVEAQGAGDFYVLIDQALQEAAHTVLAELRPDAPDFRPLSGEPLFERLEASFEAAVVTFLRSLEAAPDDLVRRATAEYTTAEGRWYVENYTLAVAEAIRSAGTRVATTLRSGGLDGPPAGLSSRR